MSSCVFWILLVFVFLRTVLSRFTRSVCQQMVRAVWAPQGKRAAALQTAGRSRDRSSRRKPTVTSSSVPPPVTPTRPALIRPGQLACYDGRKTSLVSGWLTNTHCGVDLFLSVVKCLLMPEKFQSAAQTRSRCVVEIEIMNVNAPTGCTVRLNPPRSPLTFI